MPTTRSEASRSKTGGQATTSEDLSYQTPTKTAATSSSATRVTSPAKQAGDITTASFRSGIHTAERASPIRRAAGGAPAATAALLTPASPATIDSELLRVRAEEDSAIRAGGSSRLAEEALHHDEVMARIVEVEKRRRARIEEDSCRAQQSPVTDEHAPRERMDVRRDTPLDTDTHRSVRSSHRRKAEALAKIAIAKQDLEIAKAKSKVAQAELELLQADSDEEMEVEQESLDGAQKIEDSFDNTKASPLTVKENSSSNKSDIQELTSAIAMLAKGSRVPFNIDLPYFNGTSEEWLAFKRSFEDTASSYSSAQNLTRLRKAVQGKAREAVKSLLFTADNPADVIAGLEQRFGRPGAIALSELDKLKCLPRVSESPSEICVFASRVRNAVATIKMLGKPQYLYSPETLKAIVEKMPPSMKFRWFAYHQSHKQEDTPELVLLDNYLSTEADMCGDFAPPEASTDTKSIKPRNAAETSWDSKGDSRRRPLHVAQEERNQKECPHCKKEHWLTECNDFKKVSSDDRWKLVKKEGMCFKCLKSRHNRLHCKAPTCKTCNRWHHSLLHAEKQEGKSTTSPEERVTSVNSTATGESRAVYLKMLPVEVYGRTGSARILALMDEGSTISLLDSSVAQRIGASGKQEPLLLETIGGKEIEKADSHRVCIKIRGVHRRDKRPIEVRTMDGLNLSSQEVSAVTIDGCEHLKGIRDHLVYTRERPQLLIGQDNWGLIVTRRLKKGKKSDPVASLTSLGWTLHGCDRNTSAKMPVKFINHFKASEAEWTHKATREAPTKPTSIPRLELQAALLNSRLASSIEKEINLNITSKIYWTDSSTVLRVQADPRKFKTFVAPCLAEIEELTCPQDWRWVPTKENPAGDATRGTPRKFNSNTRWFTGPEFLRSGPEGWPCRQSKCPADAAVIGEEKGSATVAAARSYIRIPEPNRFSNWVRLLRTTARVFRYMELLRTRNKDVRPTRGREGNDKSSFKVLSKNCEQKAVTERGIKCKSYPTRVSQYGGAWECLMRSVKTALSAVLTFNPPKAVVHTLITEIEHIINSRPLTDVSMDPEEEESLTPNHFLLGRSCAAMAPGETSDRDLISRANWRTVQRLADHFWARWMSEYLPLLMPRKITGRVTTDPCTGDIVLVVDATLPRNTWPRGEVIRTYPGPDGRTRMMDVRTPGGVLRRPTRRVVVLVPATAETASPLQDGVLRTAGENVSDAS